SPAGEKPAARSAAGIFIPLYKYPLPAQKSKLYNKYMPKSLAAGRQRAMAVPIAVFIIFSAIPATIFYYDKLTADTLTSQVVNQAAEIADFTASAVRVKLDHLVAIGTSITQEKSFSDSMLAHNWGQAVNIARDLENGNVYYDPYIDRMAIYDTQPIMK